MIEKKAAAYFGVGSAILAGTLTYAWHVRQAKAVKIPPPQGYYTFTFTESGLPQGAQWCILINAKTYCSSSNKIVVQEPEYINGLKGFYQWGAGTIIYNGELYKPHPCCGTLPDPNNPSIMSASITYVYSGQAPAPNPSECPSTYALLPPSPQYTAAPNLWILMYPIGYPLPVTCDMIKDGQVFAPYINVIVNGKMETMGGCYLSAPQDLLSYYASLCGD